jgi:hypothetical protein
LRVVRELDSRGEIRLRLAELAEARDDGSISARSRDNVR